MHRIQIEKLLHAAIALAPWLFASVALAQVAGPVILGAPVQATVGDLIALTAECEAVGVPTSSTPSLIVLILMLVVGAVSAAALQRRWVSLLAALAAVAISSTFGGPAHSAACTGVVSWQALSANESFVGSGPSFSFTPLEAGTFEVTATTGGSDAVAIIPVCLSGVVIDECGVCGGDGAACLCTVSFAVGYPGNGRTCSFDSGAPSMPDLPAIALDEFQYNELFSGAGYNTPFGPSGGGFQTQYNGDWGYGTVGEGRGCGACLEISGVNGSIVGMVQEIADIGAVGGNGYPTGVHIENAYINLVRNGSGAAVDVTIRPVPCPHTGSIMLRNQVWNPQQTWYWNAEEFSPYNSVYPLLSIEIKAEATHTQWYTLPPSWTNTFQLRNYAPQTIPIPNPPNSPVRFRFTSIYGDVLVTDPIQPVDRPLPPELNGVLYYDTGVNFISRAVDPGPCTPNYDCGNWTVDVGEECESALQQSADCGSLGAGTGTAYCDPSTCLWDLTTCSP